MEGSLSGESSSSSTLNKTTTPMPTHPLLRPQQNQDHMVWSWLFPGLHAHLASDGLARITLGRSAAEQRLFDPPYQSIEGWTEAQDGQHHLYWCTTHRTDLPVRGHLIYTHGMNDHSGRLAETWSEPLHAAGFRVTRWDLPGHGRTTGSLHGYFETVEELAKSLDHIIIDVIQRCGGKQEKVFLVAGSLGGLIALEYARLFPNRTEVDGMVILCPLIYTSPQSRPHWTVEYTAKLIRLIPWGGWIPLAKAHRGNSSPDPEVFEKFLADPLTYKGYMRVGTGLAMLDAIADIQNNLHLIKLPFIVMHGDSDRVTNMIGSQRLYEHSSSTDKTIKIYKDEWHDLMRGPMQAQIVQDIIAWCKERL